MKYYKILEMTTVYCTDTMGTLTFFHVLESKTDKPKTQDDWVEIDDYDCDGSDAGKVLERIFDKYWIEDNVSVHPLCDVSRNRIVDLYPNNTSWRI